MSFDKTITGGATPEWFGEACSTVSRAPTLMSGGSSAERDSFLEVARVGRLREEFRWSQLAIPSRRLTRTGDTLLSKLLRRNLHATSVASFRTMSKENAYG